MKQPMVVTNIRFPHVEYMQTKMIAGEFGMSINEYINYATRIMNTQKQLFKTDNKKSSNPYAPLWKIINTSYKRKPMGWSKEDEAIYSV